MEEITKQKLIVRDKTIERLKTELDEVNKLNAIIEKQLKEYEKIILKLTKTPKKKTKPNKVMEEDGSFEELEEDGSFEELKVDIGKFTQNGSYILKNLEEDYSITYINTIIQQQNGDVNARYIYHSEPSVISQKQCLGLINHINHNDNNDLTDYKLNIDDNKLKEIIGARSYNKLIKLYDGEHNTIYIRRVKGNNSMIDFHKDYSTKTLKIPLNKESDYKGGDLIYLTNGKINKPEQKIGSMTIHTNDIVHGVSPIVSGIRYSLFVLCTPVHP
tara:strand:+ start:260 stop:1078 length:819 start_codon:yes stop_codon:yes gene_type:complete